MKAKSLALLAVGGMLLTSVSVYSFTPPKGSGTEIASPTENTTVATSTTGTAVAQSDLTHFVAGSTLMVEGRVGHPKLLRTAHDELLMLEVRGNDATNTKTSAPVNLSLVIDRSGSMKGTRLRNAVSAAVGAVNRLRDGDVVSVVTFDTQTQIVVAPTTIAPGMRERIGADISRIGLGGDTCISCGVEQGMTELEQTAGMVNRMVLLSDGDANHGVRDLPGFRSMAQRARDRGISVTTIGVDVDYNEKILSAIAQESNGRHYFVENDASLERVFEQEAESLTSTVASAAEATVELAPGVELDKVFDRSFRRVGNQIVVPLGTFGRGDVKTILVKVRVSPDADGSRALANVDLAYKDLVNGTDGKCSGKLADDVTSDPALASDLDPLVASRLERSETTATLNDANNLFAQGRVDEAQRKLVQQQQSIQAAATKAKKSPFATRAADIDKDLDRQLSVINDAASGFAQPPPAPFAAPGNGPPRPAVAAAPQESRGGKAASKRNEENAADLRR